jgi:hypothetical protein
MVKHESFFFVSYSCDTLDKRIETNEQHVYKGYFQKLILHIVSCYAALPVIHSWLEHHIVRESLISGNYLQNKRTFDFRTLYY